MAYLRARGWYVVIAARSDMAGVGGAQADIRPWKYFLEVCNAQLHFGIGLWAIFLAHQRPIDYEDQKD